MINIRAAETLFYDVSMRKILLLLFLISSLPINISTTAQDAIGWEVRLYDYSQNAVVIVTSDGNIETIPLPGEHVEYELDSDEVDIAISSSKEWVVLHYNYTRDEEYI